MKENQSILILILVFICLWGNSMCINNQKISGISSNALKSDLKLIEILLSSVSDSSIKIYDSDDPQVSKRNILENVKVNIDYSSCYSAMRNFTKDLYKSYYSKMLMYSFTDVGDMGNYEGCKGLSDIAAYNVLQLNVTNLPVDIRFGLCLPKECNQDMMTNAGNVISSTLSGVVSKLATTLNIDLMVKYNFGVQFTFTQPDAWNETQSNDNSTAAYIVGGFLVVFVGISVVSSSLGALRRTPSIKDNLPSYGKKNNNLNQILQEEARVRESTKPFTFKFKQNDGAPVRLDSFGNQVDAQAENQQLLENSLFNERAGLQEVHNKSRPSIFSEIMDCFSIRRNVYSLVETKRNLKDNQELDVVEGIKVLTMCWGLITASSLYILITNIRNIYIMLKLFSLYLFALVASGNLSPDLFIFVIYFIGFIKLNQYYDKNNGIGRKDYLKLFLHRYLKIAPLYYIVFIAGWFLVPFFSSKASWYISNRLFLGCESQWYYVLLFVNNLVPFFTNALEGCYYWPYIIPNDMLLYILFPLWIIIYRRSKIAFYCLNTFFLVFGIFIAGFIAYQYDLKVGILSLEDYYLYAYEFNKPYMKFVALSCGMFTGLLYLRILDYRKATEEQKNTQYRWINYASKSYIVNGLLYIYATGMLFFIPGIPLTANQNAYTWTTAQNVAFFSFGRLGYCTCVMAFMIPIFFGNGDIIKRLLGQKLWVPFSKLSFGAYLIYPIVVSLMYNTSDNAIFLNYPVIFVMIFSILILCFLGGFGLYVFIQAPISNMIQLTSDRITGCNINSLNHEPCLLDNLIGQNAKDINEKEIPQYVKNIEE